MATVPELYDEAEAIKESGDYEGAIAKLLELLEQDEKYVLAHMALAVWYGRTGKAEEAIRHGERACELEPNEPFNFTALSVTYRQAFPTTQDAQHIQLAETAMARAHQLQAGR